MCSVQRIDFDKIRQLNSYDQSESKQIFFDYEAAFDKQNTIQENSNSSPVKQDKIINFLKSAYEENERIAKLTPSPKKENKK